MDPVEVLFRSHAESLNRLARVLVGPADAEDVLADAMFSLLSRVDLTVVDEPEGYLYRMVVNEARMFRRSRWRARRREHRFADFDRVEAADVDPDVLSALGTLSVNQRAVVFCTYWEEMTREEIAALLGMAPGTVASHLHRAKRTLAGRLTRV